MAKKKRKKNKKSKGFLSNGVLIAILVAIVGISFFRSENGKQLLDDLNENLPENVISEAVQTGKDVVSGFFGDENKGENKGENSKETATDDNNTGSVNLDGELCRVDFIDVGQGDSALVTTPDERFILVDTGPSDAAGSILGLLEERDVEEIDYLILSHPHADHIGSAREVLYTYKVNNIIMPDVSTGSATFEKLLDAIALEKEQGCMVYSAVPGKVYELSDCTMTIHGPLEIDEDELNNCSVVMTFEYEDFSVLFTGDAESIMEKKLISGGADLSCDILKVGHHGSSTSSSNRFLDAANPSAAVISCEKNNSYGHPHSEVLSALSERDIQYYVTAERGNVTVVSDGESFKVECEK